jgi:hypothetical protein
MLRGNGAVSGQEGQRSTAGTLAQQDGHSGGVQRRASRRDAGTIPVCCEGRGRVWPMTTQDAWPNRARASWRPWSFSPARYR